MRANWVRMRPGCAQAWWTFHSGQVPPALEKWKCVADWRLEILPARSTRTKKNGTARADGRCKVLTRWHTVSKPTPEPPAQPIDVVAPRLGRLQKAGVRQQQGAGEIVRQPYARQRARRLARQVCAG